MLLNKKVLPLQITPLLSFSLPAPVPFRLLPRPLEVGPLTSIQLGGLRKRCELSQRGLPQPKSNLLHFGLKI